MNITGILSGPLNVIYSLNNNDETLYGNFVYTCNSSVLKNNSVESVIYDYHKENYTSPFIRVLVGILMLVLVVLGFTENATVLYVYARTPKLRNVNIAFVIGLCLSDLGQAVLNIPFVMVASFNGQWLFGLHGCKYIGFVTTWFGLTQITLLTCIAMERYFLIVHQMRVLSASRSKTVSIIILSFVYGAGWATGPLIGWSEYKLVGGEISCSINWTIKNNLYLSYILCLFTFVWFLPLSFISFGYARIAQMIYNEKKKRQLRSSIRKHRKQSRERRVAITVLIMVGAFVLSWTPYSIMALVVAFGNVSEIPSGVYLVLAICAKASINWNPIIYIARQGDFRKACKRHLQKCFLKKAVYKNFMVDSADSNTFNKQSTPLQSNNVRVINTLTSIKPCTNGNGVNGVLNSPSGRKTQETTLC